MTNGKELGVAFIGAGIAAEMHGRGLAAASGSRLVGVYDPEAGRAKNITARFGGRVFKTLDEVLKDQTIDAVHVLTPPLYHVPLAIKAMQAGKHVLVEKPVSSSVREIRRLQAAAAKYSRVCMPAHNYIYVPSLLRARRLIEERKLGRVAAIWILYNIFHSKETALQSGRSILFSVCTHHCYSLMYLAGRPRCVSAAVSRVFGDRKDSVFDNQAAITCEMPDGAVAHLWCSLAVNDPTNDPWTVVYKVLGTNGGAAYSWNEAQFADHGGPAWGLPCYEDGFRGEIDYFLNRAVRHGECPLSTLDDAAAAIEIIEAAKRSARSGRRQKLHFT